VIHEGLSFHVEEGWRRASKGDFLDVARGGRQALLAHAFEPRGTVRNHARCRLSAKLRSMQLLLSACIDQLRRNQQLAAIILKDKLESRFQTTNPAESGGVRQQSEASPMRRSLSLPATN
jgi:hypothetical protein